LNGPRRAGVSAQEEVEAQCGRSGPNQGRQQSLLSQAEGGEEVTGSSAGRRGSGVLAGFLPVDFRATHIGPQNMAVHSPLAAIPQAIAL